MLQVDNHSGIVHVIPPITDPLGRHWEQPDRENILVDDEYAVMTRNTLSELLKYNSSFPSGVYAGKMWRAQIDASTWVLRWYEEHPTQKDHCQTHERSILIVDD